ncbi:MAG: SLC13 family permease, partial [Pseudomonadota bacterium]
MKDLLHMPLPIILLCIVFITVAVRKIGPWKLPIWLIMITAAIVVIITQQISLVQAYQAISFDVLFYLFGVFVIGQALEASHYLEHLSFKVFSYARSLNVLLLLIIFIFAGLAAFLMNDTIAIIGVPVILLLARKYNFAAQPFLLALAYSVTLGSVFTPIGNPQNLLIASQGMPDPFINFFRYLTLPTLINLLILYLFIVVFYRKKL